MLSNYANSLTNWLLVEFGGPIGIIRTTNFFVATIA
jgi:hypothetical protein